MKKMIAVALVLSCVSIFALGTAQAAQPEQINGVARTTHSGDIKGTFTLPDCITADPIAVQVLVYVPETSIVARAVPTDGVFSFRLFNVPKGPQSVLVDVLDPAAGSLVTFEIVKDPPIFVKKLRVLDLDPITLVCPTTN